MERMMWKEEITEYSTVIVFCKLTWLSADTMG